MVRRGASHARYDVERHSVAHDKDVVRVGSLRSLTYMVAATYLVSVVGSQFTALTEGSA